MEARPVAKLTEAEATPSTFWRAFSTRLEQAAQDMPWTCKSVRSSPQDARYPVFSTTFTKESASITWGLCSITAFSVAKFTEAASTPSCFCKAFSTRLEQAAQLIPSTFRVVFFQSALIYLTSSIPCKGINSITQLRHAVNTRLNTSELFTLSV